MESDRYICCIALNDAVNDALKDAVMASDLTETRIVRKSNFLGVVPLQCVTLVAINAPMDSGKTDTLASVVRRNLLRRVLIITFRRLVVYQLATRFGAFCYSERSDKVYTTHPPYSRICVCLNSILSVPAHLTYDCVIWYGMDLTKMHPVENTFGGRFSARGEIAHAAE